MAKSRMTDKWRCALLVRWLAKRGVRFKGHLWEARVHVKSDRLYRGSRGQAEIRQRFVGKPVIRVWAPKEGHAHFWRDLINCIIHEYGHVVLARVPHTEREAWAFGRRAVPRRFVPSNYADRRKSCLATYGAAADRRLACKDHAK